MSRIGEPGKAMSPMVLDYCDQHSLKPHPAQVKIREETVKLPNGMMLGSQIVFEHCANLIRLIKGKRVLDVGMFTGASALSWALAIPPDGEVITMDVNEFNFKKVGEPIIKEAGVRDKVKVRIQPALKTLDALISDGQKEKFDFAFIDADKEPYPDYYERCLQLIRPGGILAVDNSFRWNTVFVPEAEMEAEAKIVHGLNKKIHQDPRVDSTLLPIGDGLMVAFKKH